MRQLQSQYIIPKVGGSAT